MRKLLLFLLMASVNSFGQTLESDRLALVAVYNSMGADQWFNKTGWNVPGTPGESPCGWYGVTCESGRVTGLDLSNNNLGGTIPAEIGNLSALKSLNFSFSTDFELPEQLITGNIPAEIGNLTSLEYLNLAGVRCDGSIPATIGNLTLLKTLDLSFVALDAGFTPYGNLSGSIPVEIGNLTNLQYLDLSFHNFMGELPVQLGNLVNLEYLYLPGNDFSGSLPGSLGNLVKLKHLFLSYSDYLRSHEKGLITGPIPATFTNLAAIEILDFDNQSLTGPIPNLSGIPVSAHVSIVGNQFNFSGMESNISRLDRYAPQQLIDAYLEGPLCLGCVQTSITPSSGGTVANNTYKLFKNNVLISTTVGNDHLTLDGEGVYRVEVTNSLVPGLTLVTKNYAAVKLPVTLVSFEGQSENKQTKLTWTTTSETNNQGFEIERSADARKFQKIGFVDGSGDSKEVNTYHFIDSNPFPRTYYRLKQLDHDGKFEYSKVIFVKGDGAIVKVYPNPAQEYLTVSGIAQMQPFSIIDINGRVVLKGQVVEKGQINVKSLTPGRYIVSVGGESSRLLIH